MLFDLQMKALHRRLSPLPPKKICEFDRPECCLKSLMKMKPNIIQLDQMVNYQQRKTDFIWVKIQETFIMSVLSEAMCNEF